MLRGTRPDDGLVERIAQQCHESLPHLSIVCWRSRVHDTAAKVFSRGFYNAIASGAEGSVSIATAYDAGRAAFLRAGYCEGNPNEYLHTPGHPHVVKRIAEWRQCPGCNPPVHGQPVLVAKARGSSVGAA